MDIKIISASEACEAITIQVLKKYHNFIKEIALSINRAVDNCEFSCSFSYPVNMTKDDKSIIDNFFKEKGYRINHKPSSTTVIISWGKRGWIYA